jgi:hypothetical protein
MKQHFVIRRRREEDIIQREVGLVRLAVTNLRFTSSCSANALIVSEPANARTPKCLRSLSDSFAAAPADRFMHAPQLKKMDGHYRPSLRHQASCM